MAAAYSEVKEYALPSAPRPKSPTAGFSPEGAFASKKDEGVWILPLGATAAQVLAESAAQLAQCSLDDLRLLKQAQARTRRRASGSTLCTKSVEAAQNAVATAVAVARDVKAEHLQKSYFFSPTKDAETARRARSPSPMGPREERRVTRTPARSQSPRPRSASSERGTPRTDVSRRARSQSPAAPRAATPRTVEAPRTARRSESPVARRDASSRSSTETPRTRRSQSPAAPRVASSRLSTSNAATRARPRTSGNTNNKDDESPEDLRRQIDALTHDLERLKERHRLALERQQGTQQT